MKKKLIALAVAGALAAPVVASAQGTNVTIFGRVQAEYSLVDFAHAPSQGAIKTTPARHVGACISPKIWAVD